MENNIPAQEENVSGGKNRIKTIILVIAVIFVVASPFLWRGRHAIRAGLSNIFSGGSFERTSKKMTFSDSFSEKETLEEAGKMKSSKNSHWWVNSGALANFKEGILKTNQGDLDEDSNWRKLYNKNNSRDTEDGRQPQNIFRLVSRDQWQNLEQTLYFRINKINLSDSDYRNESNGVLLFNRYQDGDNLYYTGVRVDGHAVIKKKVADKYYTLAEKPVLTARENYDRNDSPNLLPINSWIGIRSEVTTISDDTVSLKLYVDKKNSGDWQLAAEAKDIPEKYGKKIISDPGYVGIRTDFMDVEFKDYEIFELK